MHVLTFFYYDVHSKIMSNFMFRISIPFYSSSGLHPPLVISSLMKACSATFLMLTVMTEYFLNGYSLTVHS